MTNTSLAKPRTGLLAAITAVLVLALVSISIFSYGAAPLSLLIFAAFFIFYVQLPGMAILDLFRISPARTSTGLALGLFSGWAFNIAVYFINDFIRNDFLLYVMGPVMSAVFIVSVIRRGKDSLIASFKDALSGISLWLCLFVLLALCYSLMTTQYLYLSPDMSEWICVNPDKAYHMGLIDSLSHDYPLESLWIQGRHINYHIFTEILYSIPVRLFNMDADFVLMSCGPYFTTYAFCVSLYSFFAELTSKPDRAGLYCLLVMLSNLYITKSYYNSIAFKFALTNDNSAGFGIAAAMMFMVLFHMYYESTELSTGRKIGFVVLLGAFMMLTTGIKGPMGAVLIAGLWGTFILGFILRKVSFKQILPLLILTAGFLLIYLTVLGSKGQSNGSGQSVISFATITNIAFWKKPLIAMMKAIAIPKSVRLLVVLLVFMIFFLTAFFLPFCIGYLRELFLVLTGKKKYDFTRVLVYAAWMVGFICMFILNYSGHSQIYFGLLPAFLSPIISFWLFEDLEDQMRAGLNKGRLLKFITAVFACSIICTSALLGIHISHLIPANISHTDPEFKYGKYLSMSDEEYTAMKWIKDNTPEDSLLATDRYYSVSLKKYSYENRWSNRFFLYASYSNRFCYIAGSGYNLGAKEWPVREEMIEINSTLYDADNEDRGDTARELGIDYVVVSKRFTKVPDLTNEDYEICYTNDDIDIYEIKDAA